MALPADIPSLAPDASAHRKFYTISASLRETYDDNVNTSMNGSKQASLETELSPSILVNFPMENSDFSARYTFDITYYSRNGPSNNVNNGTSTSGTSGSNTGSLEYTHEFNAQYTHSFSERFNLISAEDFRYFTEPSLYESTGTSYNDGTYVSNSLSASLSAQWTPLLGTTTTYANTIVKYEDTAVAAGQNNMENTGSQTFSFAVFPKISLNFGGIGDTITYDSVSRGYTSYTGFIGSQWQALSSLSLSGRGGGTYTETGQSQAPATISPYGALSIGWTLGARSALSFSYTHEIAPTDQAGANGQVSDQFSANFKYDITPSLSSHLQGMFSKNTVSASLTNSGAGGAVSPDENVYSIDTGLTYHYNNYLDFDFGISLSGVSSEISSEEYTRDEAYFGVRGTY